MECLRLTSVSSPGDACGRLQEAAAVALRPAANTDELLFCLLHHGRNLVLDNIDIQQADDAAAAEVHFFLPSANLKEPDEKMVNVHRPLSDLHHEISDSYPVCDVTLSQSVTGKDHNVMVTLDRSQQSNANPSGKKCVINMSKCLTSPVSASDTTAEAQLSNDSPDVQITDKRNLNVSCSQLCKKLDDASNSIVNCAKPHVNRSSDYAPASKVHYVIKGSDGSSRRKKLPHDPRRVLLQSNPPVPETNRFPVSDLERRYYAVFCRLARSERYQCMMAIIYLKVRCSYLSLGQSLRPGGHVNNFLISVFCRKLFDDCHPSVSKKHYFFSYIGENILKYNNKDQFRLIRNAFKGASLAKKIDSCEQLFFPICHCKHWFLFVVDLQNHLFAFMDSLYSKKSRYQVVVSDLLVLNFKRLWKELVDPDYSFDNFRIVYPDIPRQGNGNDCGVFVMKCMEIWSSRVVLHDYFSRVNIPNIRIQYANQLFFSSMNTADKSLVTNFFGEGKFHRARKTITSDSYESCITRIEKK